LRESGWRIGAVVTRSAASARRAVRFIGAGKPCKGMTRQILASHVILIATPDDEIANVALELARIGEEELLGKTVLHTSGALDSSVLQAVRGAGAVVGSIHPLQSFSRVAVPLLDGRVFTVEGDAQAVRAGRQIARALGGSPILIAGSKKVLYHTAAAMVAGHVLAIEEAATHLLLSLGMKRREAVRALLSLTRQVLENFERLGPHEAWTGPLSRADFKIVRAHWEALQDWPEEYAQAHEALSRLAARVLPKDPAAMLAELEEVFADKTSKARAIGGNA
jgi:predicted short-subunit dehydrogenase-like oxidoreductase (DUF2520 family)